MVIKKLISYLNTQTSILPLAIFRMAFGFLMVFSMFRFMYNGWIEEAYTNPTFHFTYQYFSWVKPFDVSTMYIIVATCGIAALCVGLGFLYRVASIIFFISFIYLELIEKSWYLNHYYFVSLIAFLLILVPANKNYALDTKLGLTSSIKTIPNWSSSIIQLQLCTVYFYGGIAKLSHDWLINAQPLKIWFNTQTNLPLIGSLFQYDITPYLFSWSGMLYDLTIPFLLWFRKCRPTAYLFVVVFHVLTYILFNIGIFPWLMIFGSLIFITEKEWRNLLKLPSPQIIENAVKHKQNSFILIKSILVFFFALQFTIPLRHHFITDNVMWTENGFRFSWQVMVMEKSGYTAFTILDKKSCKKWIEYPKHRLTKIQETQMSFQPDMIWQYAQYLKEIYKEKGFNTIEIYVNSKVALNGRTSQIFINPKTDLLALKSMDDIYNKVLKIKPLRS